MTDTSGLTDSNVDSAGFGGRVDFRTLPVGSYSLRVALGGNHVGIFPTTIHVVDEIPTNTLVRTAELQPAGDLTLFEPRTSYTATFEAGSAHDLATSIVRANHARLVLDCGCADGSFGAHLADELHVEVHGLEYDEAALSVPKTRPRVQK